MRAVACFALTILGLIGLSFVDVGAAEPGDVGIEATKDHITFTTGKDLFTRYHIAPTVAKPYFWPLNGPGGVPLTRAWPMVKGQAGETTDHPHQKSAWFCHGDIIPEGIELKVKSKDKNVKGVDFWSEAEGHGIIACTKVGEPKITKNHGQIQTTNEWRTADGVKLLDEIRTIHLYDFGDAKLLVVASDLQASAAPLIFGDTKEGSFGIRINDSIREATAKGKLENAEGKTGERTIWGYKSPWCDYSGTIEDKPVGLAIFDDPSNKYPASWHSRGYGLMAANPFGREKSFPGMKGQADLAKLAKGEHLKLRYGILIHPGDAKAGNVAKYYQEFVKMKD